MAEPTKHDREVASALLDDLTFGGHSQDGAVELLARKFAEQRDELVELLTLCSAGRTEYAGGISGMETNPALVRQRETLETEANTLRLAAQVVQRSYWTVASLLPSWRLTPELETRFRLTKEDE